MGIDRCVVSECRLSLISGYALLPRGVIHSRKNADLERMSPLQLLADVATVAGLLLRSSIHEQQT